MEKAESISQLIIAWIIVTLICVTMFKYGIKYTFDIDTGYKGPFILLHLYVILATFKTKKNQ